MTSTNSSSSHIIFTQSLTMAKLLLLHLLAILSIALTGHATQYIVGDTSGWDISSSLETWPQDKVFKVGDVLGKSLRPL